MNEKISTNNVYTQDYQLKHIDFKPPIKVPQEMEAQVESGVEAPSVPDEKWVEQKGGGAPQMPYLVLETFGPKPSQLLDIFRQSSTYAGESQCILGINEKLENPIEHAGKEKKKSLVQNITSAHSNLETKENQLATALNIEATKTHSVVISPFV